MGQSVSYQRAEQKLGKINQPTHCDPDLTFEEKQQVSADRRLLMAREVARMREASLRRIFEEVSHKRFSGEDKDCPLYSDSLKKNFGLNTPSEQYASYVGLVVTLAGLPSALRNRFGPIKRTRMQWRGALWAGISTFYLIGMGRCAYAQLKRKFVTNAETEESS